MDDRRGVSRREALLGGAAALAGMAATGAEARAGGAVAAPGRAKSVIQIWVWGGPSNLDTFDPKPEAGQNYCGPFNAPIATNVAGIRINENLPELAKIADKYSIIRSMTHWNNGHETASYITQTGRTPGAQGISEQRQRARRDLLHRLDTFGAAMAGDARVAELRRCEEQAYDMILGDAGKVFDLSQEKDDVRQAYGRSTFGQSCLMARRLVEKGVPYVTINYPGWDTHKQHFPAMRRKLPEMDRGMAALISDLSQRGLLESTIVWWGGEFGRTPVVQWEAPWDGGRSHYGQVFGAVLAGGGFRGGQVVGASDARGEEVKERPVHPAVVLRSIYTQMGIDPNAKLPHPQGLDVRVAPTTLEAGGPVGVLQEIM
ncbi:MAG: DUF1501 domain-containing protein [Armatimonadetes bacterium]|nr:DUF1501 domain-containing protein [Armatimonadota bacterium]